VETLKLWNAVKVQLHLWCNSWTMHRSVTGRWVAKYFQVPRVE